MSSFQIVDAFGVSHTISGDDVSDWGKTLRVYQNRRVTEEYKSFLGKTKTRELEKCYVVASFPGYISCVEVLTNE